MNVCFVSRVIPPSYNIPKDGNTFLAIELPRCFSHKGHSLIIGGKSTLDKYDLEFLNLFERVICFSYSNNKIKDSLIIYQSIQKILKRTKVDILHLFNTDFLLLPLLNKMFKETRELKLIQTVSMPFFGKMTTIDYFLSQIKSYAYQNIFDGICATSPLLYDLLIKQKIDKEKIFLVPPPINCNFFKPKSNYRKTKVIEHTNNVEPVILYFGDLHPLRFPANKVLKAIKLLKKNNLDVILKIVSRYGSDHIMINKMAKEMNIFENVICYTKSLKNEEKIVLYSTASVVLFPFEGFMGIDPPATLLEAMSCGKIVLVSKTQSMPYIIKNGVNGIIVDPLTPRKLADELKFAIKCGQADEIGFNARKTILQNFSQENVSKKLVQMYQQVL